MLKEVKKRGWGRYGKLVRIRNTTSKKNNKRKVISSFFWAVIVKDCSELRSIKREYLKTCITTFRQKKNLLKWRSKEIRLLITSQKKNESSWAKDSREKSSVFVEDLTKVFQLFPLGMIPEEAEILEELKTSYQLDLSIKRCFWNNRYNWRIQSKEDSRVCLNNSCSDRE